MPSARDCARIVLEGMPALRRMLGSVMRQQRGPDGEPLSFDQARLLKILGHESRALGELAARHGVTPSTMSRSVDVLVRQGLVSRESDPADRRQVILRLTDLGRAAHTRHTQQIEDGLTRLIEELSDEDQAKLFDGLTVLNELGARARPIETCGRDPVSQSAADVDQHSMRTR